MEKGAIIEDVVHQSVYENDKEKNIILGLDYFNFISNHGSKGFI